MRTSFNDGFSFLLMNNEADLADFLACKEQAKPVRVPHDWTIGDANRFYEDGLGCYIKNFIYATKDKARVFLRFDGIYMDSKIYLNGKVAGEWKYGYTSFVIDITDLVKDGDNELVVLVDYRCPNSRWYSGAGIYRNVWLIETDETYIPDGGIYVHTEPVDKTFDKWKLFVEVQIENENPEYEYRVHVDDRLVCSSEEDFYSITKPELWEIDSPILYNLTVELCKLKTNTIVQAESLQFGFRHIEFTTDKGAFLNGKHIKLNGVCEHHDFGCLGSSFYEEAWERKIDTLKDMGVNSIRLTHNPSDPKVYEVCDKKGVLCISEAFDMWESPKTTYDYARFFKNWYEKDVERWILDARNHPSVILWSIGNEIHDTHAGERGREVARLLTKLVERLDYRKNARVTLGSNYIPWENTQKVADDIKIIGYNYAPHLYEKHHEKHPDWIIYGSETSSIVFSRGVYHFPLAAGILCEDDYQCSALGNSPTSWGAKSLEYCNSTDRDTEFSLGQFLWTGFDYIGEPTPYHTKNSYFGQIDTAGFPKDSYYYWKSAWTNPKETPMLHLFPYWSFNEGQSIDIRVCTNLSSVELFVNGKSLGRKCPVDNFADFSCPYEDGYIEAKGFDEAGELKASEKRCSFGDTEDFNITVKRYGRIAFYEIQAIDSNGNSVENACDRVKITVDKGTLLGTDNGDSTDMDSYLSDERFLFRGKLLAVVEENENSSSNICVVKDSSFIRVRDIKLKTIVSDKEEIAIEVSVLPCNATNKEITFALTDKQGNPSRVATVSSEQNQEGYKVKLHPVGDGEYILRATTKDGFEFIKVISTLSFVSDGLGIVYADPYDFVPGSTYSRGIGDITNGNERGISTAREGATTVIFDNVDFGDTGTTTMYLPIFALTDDHYQIEIWKGVPGEADSVLLNNDGYCKPSIWNTYQTEEYTLSERLKGIQTISIRIWTKVHLKGFSCKAINPIFEELQAAHAVNIYGDKFTRKDDAVYEIGNNVTIVFGEYDFADGVSSVTVCGHCRNGMNPLHLRLNTEKDEIRTMVEFEDNGNLFSEQSFAIEGFKGRGELAIVFLPGCDFDLKWIKFT